MEEQAIAVLAIQETHTAAQPEESRSRSHWYYSGNQKNEREFAGVAFAILPQFKEYIGDVIPVSPRILTLTLSGAAPLTLICAYAPQSGRTDKEKEDFIKTYKQHIKQQTSKDQ